MIGRGAGGGSAADPGKEPGATRPKDSVQLFFLLARKNGYITDAQCSILKGMAGSTMGLDGLLSLISLWNMGEQRLGELRNLASEIEAMSAEQIASRIQDMQYAPPRLIAVVPLELQWFCYLATKRGLLTEEQCIELDAELGPKRDFLNFAQAVVVILPTEKFPQIQQLVEIAMEYANTGRTPPARILDPSIGL